jgi:TPR repeat protein
MRPVEESGDFRARPKGNARDQCTAGVLPVRGCRGPYGADPRRVRRRQSTARRKPSTDVQAARESVDAKDYDKALRPLAASGNADAQHELGGRYAKGKGVPEDHAEAVKWYRKAAGRRPRQGGRGWGFTKPMRSRHGRLPRQMGGPDRSSGGRSQRNSELRQDGRTTESGLCGFETRVTV